VVYVKSKDWMERVIDKITTVEFAESWQHAQCFELNSPRKQTSRQTKVMPMSL